MDNNLFNILQYNMNKVSLKLYYNDGKNTQFKLASIKRLNSEFFFTFTTKKKIFVEPYNYMVEIKETATGRNMLLQLSVNRKELNEFFKKGEKYLQQEYDYDSFKLFLRYGIDLYLKEIVYKF